MKQKQKPPVERNPFVQHLMFKKSGSHQKSKKIERRKVKLELKRDYFKDKFLFST